MKQHVIAILAVVVAGPALAAGNPDATRGIVAEYCRACHEVPGFPARHGKAEVPAPAFLDMAEQPDVYTEARLRAFLQKPHHPMRKFTLSPSDIENLIAFIRGVRRQD